MNAKQVRKAFLDFFKSKDHLLVESAPIVVKNDPTLLFTNAGMNQFKDSFLGIKPPAAARIADTQKCLRVSGKHNDLEEVGHDTYHHTMFEMLGNWSFGNYYKKEAIEWAWELLTKVYNIDKNRIYVSVFGGDAADGLPEDAEAREEWMKWIAPERILNFSKKDNFWEMGDTGPCGPCSEIHVDIRNDEQRNLVDGKTLVNAGNPEVIEIWNLVFMEFNRKADRSLESLPAKSVDTGMGFERLCMVLQGHNSTYDIDLFHPFRNLLEKEFGCKYGRSTEESIAMRVVMDHIRAITFAIADGQIPSNTGAGYVIRRILRRASRYGFTWLNLNKPFLYRLVEVMANAYDGVFPNVKDQKEFITRIVEEEEKGFLRKLERGSQMFEEFTLERANSGKKVSGEFAFQLYDTYGFPFDLTELMAREKGWTVDEAGFKSEMEKQKQRSREATEVKAGDWVELGRHDSISDFVGYDSLSIHSPILRYRTMTTKKENVYQVVLVKTPFYAESGGQVGDTGIITNGEETLRVLDTKKENDLIIQFTDRLPEKADGEWHAIVDTKRRRLIRANHSATHLLHAALREVLGTHVEQKGSLVSDEVLRFDFSHFAKMTDEEIERVERMVNEKVAAGIQLEERRNVPINEAKQMGAMALFGEKYGDNVRVIMFDPEYSIELCGGTHVANTHEIRLFRIVSESSIAAGVRRIEAVTSDGAFDQFKSISQEFDTISGLLKANKNVSKGVEDLIRKNKELEKELEKLNAEKVSRLQSSLKEKVKEVNGVKLLNEVVEVPSAEDLKTLCFNLRQGSENLLVVLGAVIQEKPMLNVILSDDLVGKYDASKMVRELAREIQGGGGGQNFFASAGGKDAGKIAIAVKKAEEYLKA